MTGARGAIPIQAPHLLKALIRQDTNVVALPAARRRPHGAGLRQRRVPDAALQPVRLLRGRADPRVTGDDDRRRPAGLTYHEALAGAGRPRPLRDPAGPGPDAGAAARARRSRSARSVARSSPGPTARAASWPSPAPRCAPPGYASATTPKPHLVTYRERIQVDGRPIAADDFARLVERGPGGRRPGRAAGTASRPSSSC